ncbi:hypothetical protein JHK87_021579 [Glycine soja]|nr:hypothetical protein JHK87_021579 [Glycine soja]
MKKKVKRLKDMVEPDKNCETRVEDVAWLCSLSESEIDMLISLKLLIIQRAKMMGCKELASKFNLKMIRAIALVLMEHLKAEIKGSSLIPNTSSNIQTKEAESWKQRMKRLQLLEDLKHLAYPCDNTFT